MADHVSWFSLPGGQVLCEAGETADELYFLRAGRLAAIRREEGQEPQFLGVIRPGEPAGEMALIAGTPHSRHRGRHARQRDPGPAAATPSSTPPSTTRR